MADPKKKNDGPVLLDHEFDGIREFDQKLPNWWLFTLYGAIAFSVVFWFIYIHGAGEDDITELHRQMALIEKAKLSQSFDITNNDRFWQMAANTTMVNEGHDLFMQHCKTCHGANLQGGIGENLVDNQWKHGHMPSAISSTIYDGVL